MAGDLLSQDRSARLTDRSSGGPRRRVPRGTRATRARARRRGRRQIAISPHHCLTRHSATPRLPPRAHAQDSYLEEGFILNKKIGVGQPKRIENARVLIANTAMDTDKIKIFGSRVRVDSMAKVAEIEQAEKEKMKAKVAKIVSHGINCFVNRQLIYNYPEQLTPVIVWILICCAY